MLAAQVAGLALAQGAIEWAPLGAVWHYNYSYFGPDRSYSTIEVVADTVINGKAGKILRQQVHNPNYEKGVRDLGRIIVHQDGERVYYWVIDRFTLLYDFSAKVGDTLKILVPEPDIYSDSLIFLIVDSIESMSYHGQVLRRQYLTRLEKGAKPFFLGASVTELIGSSRYLIPGDELSCDSECPRGIRCYSDPYLKLTDLDPFGRHCDSVDVMIVGTDNFQIEHEGIRLYPNPVKAGITQVKLVRSTYGLGDEWEYQILDIYGRPMQPVQFLQHEGTIDVGMLEPGVYFLAIWGARAYGTKKLMVQ